MTQEKVLEPIVNETEQVQRVPVEVQDKDTVSDLPPSTENMEMNKEEAHQVLMNFQVDQVPAIMNKTPKAVKHEESKPSNVYIAELQALKRENEELKSKYEFLQKRGVQDANLRFEEFKAIAEKRFEESEQLIALLQKENERWKSGNHGSEWVGEPSKEVQDLKAKLMQQLAKEELQTQTLTSLLQEKKQLELNVKEITKELVESRSLYEKASEQNKKLESSVMTWKSEYESVKNQLQTCTHDHAAKVVELEESKISLM
jgi:chromosome segregation ATPase